MKGAIFIGFNGPPGVGKDTGAAAVMSMPGVFPVRKSFADSLKTYTCRFFNTPERWPFYENMKDIPNKSFLDLTPRQAYIWMSEEVIKPKFGQDFWSQAAITHYKMKNFSLTNCLYYPLLAADVGFNHELIPVLEFFHPENVLIIRVSRDQCTFKNDSREWIQNEELKNALPFENLVSITNKGPIAEYQTKVQSIVSKFINDKRA